MGNKRRRKRRESPLELIRVIIGGQSPQRQLEGVDVMRRVVNGENGGGGGVRGNNTMAFPKHKELVGNGGCVPWTHGSASARINTFSQQNRHRCTSTTRLLMQSHRQTV